MAVERREHHAVAHYQEKHGGEEHGQTLDQARLTEGPRSIPSTNTTKSRPHPFMSAGLDPHGPENGATEERADDETDE